MNMKTLFKRSGRSNILTFTINTLYQINDSSRITCKITSDVIFLTSNSTNKCTAKDHIVLTDVARVTTSNFCLSLSGSLSLALWLWLSLSLALALSLWLSLSGSLSLSLSLSLALSLWLSLSLSIRLNPSPLWRLVGMIV